MGPFSDKSDKKKAPNSNKKKANPKKGAMDALSEK
jgi:hypothetical protein